MAKATKKQETAPGTELAEQKSALPSTMNATELAALAKQTQEADRRSRAAGGLNVTFISLAKTGTQALLEENAELYVEGLQLKEFFVQSTKTRLGKKLRVIPLYFLSVYNEMTSLDTKTSKFVGVWRKQDAEKFDLAPGNYFDRELPNGNYLRPATWMMLYLPDHPEIENPVITFKSTGQRIVKNIQKAIKANGDISCSVELELVAEMQKNDHGQSWYDIGWEITDRTFEVMKDGSVKLYAPYAEKCLVTAKELAEADKASLIVAQRSAGASKQDSSGASSDDDDDDYDDDDDDDGDYDDSDGARF